MTNWLYLMTKRPGFPEPLGEIATLGALSETGEVCLLLAGGPHPPMSGARPGDSVLLCTRGDDKLLRKHAVARVGAPPVFYPEPPEHLRGLYPDANGRLFLPLVDFTVVPTETVSEMTVDQQRTMAAGQAYVRRLDRPINPPRAPRPSVTVRSAPRAVTR